MRAFFRALKGTIVQFESRATVGLPSVSGVSTNITPASGGVAIHYNGGAVGITASHPHSQCRAWVKNTHNYHVNGNGWAYFAYSLAVCQHGIVMEGRGIGRRTAANGTNYGNQHYYAIVAVLGGNETPTTAMLDAIADAVAYLRSQGGAGNQIRPHSYFLATSCPGNKLRNHITAGRFDGGSGGGRGGDLPVLMRGSTGPAVVAWQQDLLSVGVPLPQYGADGDFGAETETATKQFQGWRGIVVDGIVGPESRGEMAAAKQAGDQYPGTSGSSSTVSAKTAKTVKLAVDGDFGPATIRATQQVIGATVDGLWGPESMRKLQQYLNRAGASLAVDGIVGKATVMALQRHLNKRAGARLVVDGVWGPATTRALQTALNNGRF